MPGPVTHLLFYRQLKARLGGTAIAALPAYDACSIFAQGHDLLIYHDFYKITRTKDLERNVQASNQLQEFLFPEFVYNYLNHARKMGALNHEQIQLFLGPGYIAHHMLDAYTHLFIIFQAGDHVRDPRRRTWMHGIAENQIDIEILARMYPGRYQGVQVHKLFAFPRQTLDPALPVVLDASLMETYQFPHGGRAVCQAMFQVPFFMWLFKDDPSGVKRLLFDEVDPLLKGAASFSYHRPSDPGSPFLNEVHEDWCNPMDRNRHSHASFFELYDCALTRTARILRELSALYDGRPFTLQTIRNVVPDIASTHGLTCGQRLKIRYTRERAEGGAK